MKPSRCHPWFIAGAILAAISLCGSLDGKPAGKGKKEANPNYYPMDVGNEWRFKLTVGDVANSFVSRIGKMETIDGVALARLDGYVDGKVVATEHLRQTADGIFRYRFNGQDAAPPFCLLKYPVTAKAKWEGEFTIGKEKGKFVCETAEENIEVPAGKFKTLRVSVRLDSNGQIVNTVYWFVPNIGFVRQTADTQGVNVLLELEKFTPAKPPKK